MRVNKTNNWWNVVGGFCAALAIAGPLIVSSVPIADPCDVCKALGIPWWLCLCF